MIKEKLNEYNYGQYGKYYTRINIDNQDFFVKLSGELS